MKWDFKDEEQRREYIKKEFENRLRVFLTSAVK
jgi:hypothetical protein